MTLAKLFYLREALRRRTQSVCNAWGRKRPVPRASQFHMESLENRVLLSAAPAVEDLSATALETAALTAPANSVSLYATEVPAYVPKGAVTPGTPVVFNLNYSTAGPIDFSGQTVISFRVHFDANELAFPSAGFTRNTGMNEAPFFIAVLDENAGNGTVDSDASTNKYVFIQYLDSNNSLFPSSGVGDSLQVLTSAVLGQIRFLTTGNFDGSTIHMVAAPPPLPPVDGTNLTRVLDTAPIVLNTFPAAGRTISINDIAVGEGAGTATFTVAVSPGAGQVSFGVSVVTGGATAGVDFGTPVINPVATSGVNGEDLYSITVPITNDAILEGEERFALNLTNVVGATVVKGQGTGFIHDNEQGPTLSFAAPAVSVVEGNAGTTANMVFTVSLSLPSASFTYPTPIQVGYETTGGTATAGVDYTAVSGTLTFAPGVTSQTFVVPIFGDNTNETDETVTVRLVPSSGVHAQIAGGSAAAKTGTIANDDGPANQPPVAVNDTVNTPLNTPVTINVLANDTDPDGNATINPATVEIVTQALHGTTVVNANGTILYTPALNYVGPDAFAYRVRDNQNAQSNSATVSLAIQGVTLDIDGNGAADALTDGLVIGRFLFGFTGDPLIEGVVDPNGTRNTALLIEEYLRRAEPVMLDVDGNGFADALSDGICIIRYLFGFTGDPLINGVVDPNGTRPTAGTIEPFLAGFMPGATSAAGLAGESTIAVSAPIAPQTTTATSSTSVSTASVVAGTDDSTMDLSLAYVQQTWLKDFVADGASLADSSEEDEEEWLIALPG